MKEFLAYVAGAIALGVFLFISGVVLGGRKSWGKVNKVLQGQDGALSTSKVQWFAWTAIVIFSYVAIYAARALQGHFQAVDAIPPNVLLVLGFSTTTMTAAKGITTAYVANGRLIGKAASADAPTKGGLLASDSGVPDLSKIQLMSWTVIAIGIYLCTVGATIHGIATLKHGAPEPGLPDIDGALMVLMGLSQGGYLGKKLVTTNTPQLTAVTPPKIAPGGSVALSGSGFGPQAASSSLCVNDVAVPIADGQWSDTAISFTAPANRPDGTAYPRNTIVQVGVYVGGQPGASTLALVINPS
jgi:IPT/TIG domain-containing protein